MNSLQVLLFASTCAALFLGIDWLFYSLGILLLCVLFLDLSSAPAPAKRSQGAPSTRRAPVVIQSGQDATAYDFVSELVSGIVSNGPPPEKK